jgi:hypothetical protein
MKRSFAALLIGFSLSFTACEKAEITTYRVARQTSGPTPQVMAAQADNSRPAPAPAPKAPTPAPTAQANMANTAVPTASGEGLAWSAPEHWKAKPTGAMRKGSYAITDERNNEADMSITAFPGNVGGELANVNRWRGQIELEPITEAEMAAALTRFEKNGLKFAVVEAVGPSQRTLGAMVPFNGATWFFKLQGPLNLVAKEKDAFMKFLESVKPAAK